MVIDEHNVGDVVDLLSSDFRSRSRDFWASGIEKLMASPAHAEQKRPVGYTLRADGALVGVGLTAIALLLLLRNEEAPQAVTQS